MTRCCHPAGRQPSGSGGHLRPAEAAIERVGREDRRFGTAVLITTDPRPMEQIDGCGGYCGGVAFDDAFAEPFARSTDTRDDVATIIAKGAPRRRDDVGATPATATP